MNLLLLWVNNLQVQYQYYSLCRAVKLWTDLTTVTHGSPAKGSPASSWSLVILDLLAIGPKVWVFSIHVVTGVHCPIPVWKREVQGCRIRNLMGNPIIDQCEHCSAISAWELVRFHTDTPPPWVFRSGRWRPKTKAVNTPSFGKSKDKTEWNLYGATSVIKNDLVQHLSNSLRQNQHTTLINACILSLEAKEMAKEDFYSDLPLEPSAGNEVEPRSAHFSGRKTDPPEPSLRTRVAMNTILWKA